MLDRIRQRMRRLCRLGDPTRVLYSEDGRQPSETTDLQRIKSSQGVKGTPETGQRLQCYRDEVWEITEAQRPD